MTLTFTKENFDQEAMQSEQPVLVDFWASWCGPCRMVGPIVDQLADEFEGKAKVGKVNVDEQPDLAMKYRVMSIPTLIIFKNGEVAERIVGARTHADLTAFLNKHID